MSETGSDTRSGLGARLRAGRERMGLTQLQAAEKLHVDAKVVDSLEGERYEVLGAPVFVRGHLKRYAELIGEQPFQLLDLYTASTQPAAPDLTRLPKVTRNSKPSRLAVPALLVLIAFVMIGVIWWIVQSVNKPGRSDSASAAHEVSTEPAAITPDADGAGPDAASASGTSTALPGTVNAPTQSAQSNNATRSGAANTATAGAASAAANGAPGGAAPADQRAAAPARGKGMEVTLRFASDSWVEVYDAKGEKLFYDIGSADSQRTITGTPPFRVTFANAPGVSLDVNGKPATVPANAVHEDAADFIINRSGRIVRARPQAAGAPNEGK
jgi:cytoskeleton protein RodZ